MVCSIQRDVSAEIARLFKDDPDLRSDFRIFMPEKSQAFFDDMEDSLLAAPTEARRTRSNTPLDRSTRRRPEVSLAAAVEAATVPQKRKRKVNERERERDIAPKTAPTQRVRLCLPLLSPEVLTLSKAQTGNLGRQRYNQWCGASAISRLLFASSGATAADTRTTIYCLLCPCA